MRVDTPQGFLSLAGAFLLLAAPLPFLGVLMLSVMLQAQVRAPLDPEDDGPWIQQSSRTTPWPLLEDAEGLSPESVVDLLGPPLRVHRGSAVFNRCQQIFVYAALLDGERVPIGLCITAEYQVRGSVGRMSFDPQYWAACGDLTGVDLAGLYVFAGLLAPPIALLLGVHHRRHPTAALCVGAEAGRRGGTSNERMHQSGH